MNLKELKENHPELVEELRKEIVEKIMESVEARLKERDKAFIQFFDNYSQIEGVIPEGDGKEDEEGNKEEESIKEKIEKAKTNEDKMKAVFEHYGFKMEEVESFLKDQRDNGSGNKLQTELTEKILKSGIEEKGRIENPEGDDGQGSKLKDEQIKRLYKQAIDAGAKMSLKEFRESFEEGQNV